VWARWGVSLETLSVLVCMRLSQFTAAIKASGKQYMDLVSLGVTIFAPPKWHFYLHRDPNFVTLEWHFCRSGMTVKVTSKWHFVTPQAVTGKVTLWSLGVAVKWQWSGTKVTAKVTLCKTKVTLNQFVHIPKEVTIESDDRKWQLKVTPYRDSRVTFQSDTPKRHPKVALRWSDTEVTPNRIYCFPDAGWINTTLRPKYLGHDKDDRGEQYVVRNMGCHSVRLRHTTRSVDPPAICMPVAHCLTSTMNKQFINISEGSEEWSWMLVSLYLYSFSVSRRIIKNSNMFS
jgi:hypothetical protein